MAQDGLLQRVISEHSVPGGVPEVTFSSMAGRINPDLSVGADLDQALALRANERISSHGMSLHGAGFIVPPAQAKSLGLGRVPGLEHHIRPYLNGRDLTQRSRGLMVIDLFGLRESAVRARYPAVFERVLLQVKPERDQNSRSTYRERWWTFGEPRSELRRAMSGVSRYVATVETAKHRLFCSLPGSVLPDPSGAGDRRRRAMAAAEFQAPTEQRAAVQESLPVDQPPVARLAEWPGDDQSRLFALRASLAASPGLLQELSRRFSKASTAKIKEALAMLTASRQVRCAADGGYHFRPPRSAG